MKKLYVRPSVVEYGTLGQLTQGTTGALPDIHLNGAPAGGPGCAPSTANQVACVIVS